MGCSFRLHTVVAMLCLGIFVTAPAFADTGNNSPIYGVDEKVAGKTHEEWTVAFFRWAWGIKKNRSPITDKTGAFAGEGQAGPVWFLGGNLGGVTRRTVSVPAGKRIFSPVIYVFPHAASAKASIDRVADVEVTLDGKSVGDLSKHRFRTRPFAFNGLAEQDSTHPLTAGKRKVAMDGYWFMLKPLPTGEHTLRIKGRIKAVNVEDEFELDITYKLKVAAGKP